MPLSREPPDLSPEGTCGLGLTSISPEKPPAAESISWQGVGWGGLSSLLGPVRGTCYSSCFHGAGMQPELGASGFKQPSFQLDLLNLFECAQSLFYTCGKPLDFLEE